MRKVGTIKNSTLDPALDTQSARVKYLRAVQNAKKRRIKFDFTYKEWVMWWVNHLGVNWEVLRGTSYTKFCMARKKDRGIYTANNVDCKTAHDNHKERKSNGTTGSHDHKGIKNPRAKLTEQEVKEIYLSKDRACNLGRKYKISQFVIHDIRKNRSWRHITNKLNRT